MPPQEQDQYDKQAEEMAEKLATALNDKNGFSFELGNCDKPISIEDARACAKVIMSIIPLASLLRDKARLDWLEKYHQACLSYQLFPREAIDAAMKETKPV